MVHVNCRATSDRTAQVSPLARVSRPPALDFRLHAVIVVQTGPCLHQKMGSMRSHGLRTKYLSNVQYPLLIRRKSPARNLPVSHSVGIHATYGNLRRSLVIGLLLGALSDGRLW